MQPTASKLGTAGSKGQGYTNNCYASAQSTEFIKLYVKPHSIVNKREFSEHSLNSP